ncbi:MAG: right-handed parallel beta-helix repeat-containing protein [Pseudomonadota bacterium]
MEKILTTIAIVVSPTGDCQSISAAIEKAKAGDRILVKPGVYEEDLVIDKPLEIIGDGEVAEIVVESKNADCIFMKTDNALVRGLSLRNRAEGYYAVDISQGKLRLEYCDISSETLSCVGIHGAEGIISYCQIHDSKQSGVYIYKNGTGRIENCDIVGIQIRDGGNPVVQHCQIHDSKQSGVMVWENGTGRIENCNIFGNAFAGIAISEGGNPVVQKCTIKENKHWAVYVYNGGAGTIENCDLRDNAKSTWHIQSACQVHRSGNKEGTYTIEVSPTGKCKTISAAIKKAKAGNRISVKPGNYQEELVIDKPLEIIGEGKVADIIIESKNASCISMETDHALVRGLSLRNRAEGYFAVYIPQGKLTLENCDISSETLSCVGIHGAEGIISYCQIHDSKQSGVMVWENGTGQIENCEIFRNALSGITITEGGNPVVHKCSIKQNKHWAVYVYKDGAATIENCDLRDNAKGAWHIQSGCQVHDSGNKE